MNSPATSTTRPSVLADVGPDGRPRAMLCTPGTYTFIDQDAAAALIADLLLVVVDTAAAVAADLYA